MNNKIDEERAALALSRLIGEMADAIKADPHVAQRLMWRVDNNELFVPEQTGATSLPNVWHAIDVSIGDKGPTKAKKTVSTRPYCQFTASAKVSAVKAGKMRKVWDATFQLYTATEFAHKLNDYAKPSKSRSPIRPESMGFYQQMIAVATSQGSLIGIASQRPRSGGTHLLDGHVIIIAPDFDGADLFVHTDGQITLHALPEFSPTYADGTDIKSNDKNDFFVQSRGIVETRDLSSAFTGHVKTDRL